MNKKQKVFITIISAILLSLLSIPAFAQSQEVVRAEVDRSEITIDEFLTLSVWVDTGYGPASEPALPAMEGFDVVGTSTSTQMSIINGSVTSEKVFHYTLRPRAAGEFNIGSITVVQNGQNHNTRPITVNVSQGTGQMQTPPQSGSPGSPSVPSIPGFPSFPSNPGFPSLSSLLQNFGFDIPVDVQESVEQLDPSSIPSELSEHAYFVEAEVDNDSPYLGEQITYTFRYYRPATSSGRSTYQPPDFSGHWVHPDQTETNFGGQIAGRSIRMTEIQTILTPTVLGEVEIAPAQISNEGDVLSPGFTIQTQPQTIKVQPLPLNAPSSFSGAVGNFTITSETDLEQTQVNDAVTFTITISGEGNLETFADPKWEIGSEWRAFESQSDTAIQSQNGVISGKRIISQVLVPTNGGELTLPAIQFSYFDPQLEKYITVATDPIIIYVDQNVPLAAEINIDEQNPLVWQDNQLRPIKNSPETGRAPSLLLDKPGFWLLWLVPLTLIIGQYGWQRRKKYIRNNPGAQRSQKAARRAYQALNKLDPRNEDYFNTAGRILINYLADKLDQPVGGLTQSELSELLIAKGASENLVAQVRTCITISEMGQYAPIHQDNSNQIHQEIKTLISELDQVL